VKRILIAMVAIASLAAGTAFGFEGNFDYSGSVKHDSPFSSIGFRIEPTNNGHRKVTTFTVTNVPITCTDSTDPRSTGGYELDDSMRIKHGEFAGSGEWLVIAQDPAGSVTGKFHPGGVATGTLRIHGELAGPGTHCHTGELGWKATKNPPL
jgi:hypothetical protein